MDNDGMDGWMNPFGEAVHHTGYSENAAWKKVKTQLVCVCRCVSFGMPRASDGGGSGGSSGGRNGCLG